MKMKGMKGTIPAVLEKVLEDEEAFEQLKEWLMSGEKEGEITLKNGEKFIVRRGPKASHRPD